MGRALKTGYAPARLQLGAKTDRYQPIERKLGLTPTLKNSERRSANA